MEICGESVSTFLFRRRGGRLVRPPGDVASAGEFAANSQAVPYFVVGVDAHIDPLGNYEFAADYRKNGAICRADRVVRPYAV